MKIQLMVQERNKQMNKEKKRKILIIVIIISIILLSTGIGTCLYLRKHSKEKPSIKQAEILENIEGYDYKLEDRDTALYKKIYASLKETLEKEEINYEDYARYIAELFVVDLYTIDNKYSKYDVGSLDFIYPEEQEEFKNKVMDTLYKLVEDETNTKRNQELPIVSDITVDDSQEIEYQKGDKKVPGYKFTFRLTYQKDLGYDKTVEITVIKENNKMYVVTIAPIEANE